jgi:hypothetical protein
MRSLSKPLGELKTNDLFILYNEFGEYVRAEIQRYILTDGNVERSQKSSKILYNVISFAVERYRDGFSSTQLAILQEHQNIAKLWL